MKIDPRTLSLISHELRSPLTAVRGYVSLLKSGAFGELSDEAMHTVGQMHDNLVREVYLVNDFGAFLKLHAENEGNPEPDKEVILVERLKKTADLYSKEEEKGGKASYNVSGDETLKVVCNELLLKTAVNFLLKHAVRGGNDGNKIDLSVTAENGKIRITVKDNDEKITKGPEEIFKPLSMPNENRSGIELFVAAEAVGMLSGFSIGLLPEYKKGNIFYISQT